MISSIFVSIGSFGSFYLYFLCSQEKLLFPIIKSRKVNAFSFSCTDSKKERYFHPFTNKAFSFKYLIPLLIDAFSLFEFCLILEADLIYSLLCQHFAVGEKTMVTYKYKRAVPSLTSQ